MFTRNTARNPEILSAEKELFLMDSRKWFCFFGLILFAMVGCASADDPEMTPLSRQQSATIESLNNEIQRLNQELEGTVSSRGDLRAVMPKVEKMFAEEILRGDVRVVLDRRGLGVTVLDHALFDPDETQFTSAGEEILGKIASLLSADLSNNRVTLEGHTDNQPIENAEGVTNWEYSIGRATAVLHFFLDVKGLSPERFGVAGYAEYRPADSNAAEEGRDRNRRVEIVIAPGRGSYATSRA
ncbi:MAG: OmpA family protein [Candidatus Omnitrophica bacterium]|nr:OmpA family protein [Candidatus Omnitrophota bacterium]